MLGDDRLDRLSRPTDSQEFQAHSGAQATAFVETIQQLVHDRAVTRELSVAHAERMPVEQAEGSHDRIVAFSVRTLRKRYAAVGSRFAHSSRQFVKTLTEWVWPIDLEMTREEDGNLLDSSYVDDYARINHWLATGGELGHFYRNAWVSRPRLGWEGKALNVPGSRPRPSVLAGIG